MTTDVAPLARAMVRYEQAHEAADRARSTASLHDLALARLELLDRLEEHGYEPEPEVMAQRSRDRHDLRVGHR
jgi:hypothetical protein